MLLLIGSHIVRWASPEANVERGCCAAILNAVEGDRLAAAPVRIDYIDRKPNIASSNVPIILLHGSPGESSNFDLILPQLSEKRRVIVPDLPGFGHSTKDIPDYSIRAHAHYINQLLSHLQIERAHLLGFSMGSGVALNLFDIAPERVESITMLAGIGVQEMELLGDYRINHAVHGLQLGFFTVLHNAIPMTPVAYRNDVSIPYSRNFYDTDQRPLRAILEKYAEPMLIVHGRKDFLVPVEAAIEHRRLVPQSELVLSDHDHFMVFMKPEYLIPIVDGFMEKVEAGRALRRKDADPERVEQSRMPFDSKDLPKFIGVTAFVVFLILSAATLVSEDLTCVTAGVMVAQGRIDFWLGAFASFLGIFVGDLLLFLSGRWLGRPALGRAPIKWFIKEEAVRKSSDWFSREGAKVIFASRFLPGARLPTYFAAGALNTSFWKFALYFFIACAIWTPLLVGIAMVLGKEVVESALFGGQSLFVRVLIAAAAAYLIVKLAVKLATEKGRRLLLSSWRRLTRWEFWPPYIFYIPVVLYIGMLMLKRRGLTVFTSANPAIPGGGFIGESKAEILAGLERSSSFLPKWSLIKADLQPEQRTSAAKTFIEKNGLSYPVILKPDVGQRGSGVAIIKGGDELETYLQRSKKDVLIQEWIDGEEFGVFYYRYPDQERGRIFAITEKRFPFVTGDGVSTLENLILKDARAVCMARFLLEKHADRLSQTPANGEQVQIVDLGTHCRGAVFLDGGWAATPDLEEAIDRICKSYPGFYFGRFDIRTGDVEEFKKGRGFKVIELNGVTSEATNIYDPKNSLFEAYRVLFDQWRIAFEIGTKNRERGFSPTPAQTLLKWLLSGRA